MRKGKQIPRLPLSAFDNSTATDSFSIPPTPSLIVPSGVADAHLSWSDPDVSHLKSAQSRAVVLSTRGHTPQTILASLSSVQVDAPVLAVLVPFALDTPPSVQYPSPLPAALSAVYDGTTPIEDDTQVETPVSNLRWALQLGRAVDLDIQGSIMAPDSPFYDSLVNLLTKATRSDTNPKGTPIVLTNLFPPPLDSIPQVVSMVNHPKYTTYRQRVSLLSFFENVSVKLLPPAWVSPTENKDLKNVLKLFISPVLEAFGFERIIFGSSPAFADGSPALAECWYKLVLDSFRDLAVSQEDMNKIFIENAERVYG